MQHETLSQPLPLPRPRRGGRTVLVALLAFALGGALVAWLAYSGNLPSVLTKGSKLASPPLTIISPSVRGTRQQVPLDATSDNTLGSVETRLALLEDRLSRIDGEANAASGNAARAEALLIAFAARRRIEQGEPLGYIEDQLKLRFAGAQPKAVQTLIAAARRPITLDQLAAQLVAAAPVLSGTARDESTWTRVQREISSLFVVRRAPVSSATPQDRISLARLMLASGEIDEAIAEVQRLPGADEAPGWIDSARRYEDTQRALDLIETTAMLEPRALQDGAGKPVLQPSPLATPADAAPGKY